MADKKKTQVGKVREMGPPKSAMRDWRERKKELTLEEALRGEEGQDPTGEQRRLYQEAFLDVAESLGVSPEELKKGVDTVDFIRKIPGARGYYEPETKLLHVSPERHETKEEFSSTARHELLHAAGKEHRKDAQGLKHQPYFDAQKENEAYYWQPSLLQVPMKEPQTDKIVDRTTRNRHILEVMKKFGVKNPEEVLAETELANELFGPGMPTGLFKDKPGNPLHDLPMEEKKKRLQRLRERGWGKE